MTDDRLSAATRFASIRAQLEQFSPPPGWRSWVYEFLLFGFKQGWACLFGGLMLVLLVGTHLFYPVGAPLPRYDFITIIAVMIQIAMDFGMLAECITIRQAADLWLCTETHFFQKPWANTRSINCWFRLA